MHLTKAQKRIASGLGLLGFLVGSTLLPSAISDPVNEAEAQGREYCTSVKIFMDSNGAYGWPDYKHIYEAQCLDVATE
jgi:F420-0:gamma-glutamyl ligase-like protein